MKLGANKDRITIFTKLKQDILHHFDPGKDLKSFINISKGFFPSNLYHLLRNLFLSPILLIFLQYQRTTCYLYSIQRFGLAGVPICKKLRKVKIFLLER